MFDVPTQTKVIKDTCRLSPKIYSILVAIGWTNYILRIKEQETRLNLHEHDNDDDDDDD